MTRFSLEDSADGELSRSSLLNNVFHYIIKHNGIDTKIVTRVTRVMHSYTNIHTQVPPKALLLLH